MRIAVYFIFMPTPGLLGAAAEVKDERLTEVSVWTAYESGSGGMDWSQEALERAFWSEFRANLFFEDETEVHARLRDFCVEAGFLGCWSVLRTKGGGLAGDLIASAKEADAFLASR